jgi:hypothetical protein
MAHIENSCKMVRVDDQDSIIINAIIAGDTKLFISRLRVPFFIPESCSIVRHSDALDIILSGSTNTYLVKGKTRHDRRPAKIVRVDELEQLRRNI